MTRSRRHWLAGFASRRAMLAYLVAAAPDVAQIAADEGPPVGSVEGVVTFRGEVPMNRLLDQTGNQRPILAVDSKTRGVRYLVAFLVVELPIASARGDLGASSDRHMSVVEQHNDTFEPHLIAIRSGQVVKLTNSDFANHNVHAVSPISTNEFNVFTGVGGEYKHKFFADAQDRPVRLVCDIHAWMGGWIYVFDHPLYAVTDAQGRFRISGIPGAEYKLVFKQPDVAYSEERTIKVSPGQTTRVEVEINREDLKVH